jgi:hypothetical protein
VLAWTTFDKKGKVVKEVAKVAKVPAPASVPPKGRIELPIAIPVKIERSDKTVRVRFLVRISATGREGTADVALQ